MSLSIAVRAEKLFHWHSLTVQTACDSVCFVPLCSLSPVSPPLSCWCYPSALAPLGAHGWLWLTAWHSCQATVAMWLLADEECSRGIAAGLLSASDDQCWLERRRAHQTVSFKSHWLPAFHFSACVKLHDRHYKADSYKLRSVFVPLWPWSKSSHEFLMQRHKQQHDFYLIWAWQKQMLNAECFLKFRARSVTLDFIPSGENHASSTKNCIQTFHFLSESIVISVI